MPKFKTIGLVGTRRRDTEDDLECAFYAVKNLWKPSDRIVSGGCAEGADRFAPIIARRLGATLIEHYPRVWELDEELLALNRRAAYAKINYARNTLIAIDVDDTLVALVAEDRKGGTEDTIKKVLKMKKVVVYA